VFASDPPGIRLKIWRIRQTPPVKQLELAADLGIDNSSLSALEAGRFSPGDELKGRILGRTGIDWDEPATYSSAIAREEAIAS
jgi:transcriptional regulator with XRE-family HTH domain